MTTQMNLKGIIINEITEKNKYCMISLVCTTEKKKRTTHRNREQTDGRHIGGSLEVGGNGFR